MTVSGEMSSATRRMISSPDTSTRASSHLAAVLASVLKLANDHNENRTLYTPSSDELDRNADIVLLDSIRVTLAHKLRYDQIGRNNPHLF